MSDLPTGIAGTIAGTVEAAARSTVAPPFATVERRARARRHRQVAGVATAVIAVLAGGALALPRIEARDVQPAGGGGLKPYAEFARDQRAQEAFRECRLDQLRPGTDRPARLPEDLSECFAEAGYEPPPRPAVIVTSPLPGQEDKGGPVRCKGNFDFGPTPLTDDVAEGSTDLGRWRVFVSESVDPEHPCVGFRAGEHGWSTEFARAAEVDGEPGQEQFGGVTDDLTWGTYDFDSPTHTAFWGAVSQDADHVDITARGVTHTVPAVASAVFRGWRYVGTVFDMPDPGLWSVVVYDAHGTELARYSGSNAPRR